VLREHTDNRRLYGTASFHMRQPETSQVFSPGWVQQVEPRYGHLRRSEKSWPYLTATDGEFPFHLMREQIESWLAVLPEAERTKMIPNLRCSDGFWHTYHELAIGSFLRELGVQLQFEKQFGEQTPDWFADSKDGSPSFIVEVFTANVPDKTIGFEDRQLDDLTRRLGEIPLDFAVKISRIEDSAIGQLDPHRNKKIAEAVRMWLQTYNEFSKPRFSFEGVAFEIIDRNRGSATLLYMRPPKPIYAEWAPLRLKIEQKIRKYKNLVLSNGIPLIVAVAPGLGTDYSDFEMKNILLGGVFEESPLSHSLFANEPLLSGVLFLSGKGTLRWKVHNYLNPNATFRLPENIFGGAPQDDCFNNR
jgi:hypothetical protein